MRLGALLERAQDDGRHFRRRHLAPAHGQLHDALARQDLEGEVPQLVLQVLPAAAHQALDGVDRVGGPARELAACGLAHDDAVGREADDRGQQPAALAVGDDDGQTRAFIHVGHEAVRRPQVNADDARHHY